MQTNSRRALSSTRREFLQFLVLGATGSVLGAPGWTGRVVARLTDSGGAEGGVLRVRLSDFPPLRQEYGSVRIGTSSIDANHRPLGLFYPVIIIRGPSNQFFALDSSCSHEGCTVPTFDAQARLIQCLCHGSQYGIDGSLIRGPAGFGLRQFGVHFDGVDTLAIEQPDLSFFAADPVEVQPSTGRVHLRFLGFEQITYEVRFRPKVNVDWSEPLPFSLTETGPANTTSVVGQGDFVDVYLDRTQPQGFYAVVMKTGAV